VLSGAWRSLVFFSSLSFLIIIACNITVFVISMYTDVIKFLEFEDISFFYLLEHTCYHEVCLRGPRADIILEGESTETLRGARDKKNTGKHIRIMFKTGLIGNTDVLSSTDEKCLDLEKHRCLINGLTLEIPHRSFQNEVFITGPVTFRLLPFARCSVYKMNLNSNVSRTRTDRTQKIVVVTRTHKTQLYFSQGILTGTHRLLVVNI
jgi:hypothetical protein